MTPDQWKRLDDLFDAAQSVPRDRREVLARDRCAGEPELLAELLSLIRADRSDAALLADPVGDVAALVDAGMSGSAWRDDALIGQRLGAYMIIAVIGGGGMGVVYEARQDSPQRTVALKLVRPGCLGPSALRRFQQEVEALGRLQHAGIAQVYESGWAQTPQGKQPYFALELVRGQPLLEYAQSRSLPVRARLTLFASICEAVQHAHAKGVIHRDLKPANILVDDAGQPKILDFGIARLTDSDVRVTTLQTNVGQLIGTIPYMSPEQVTGDSRQLDTRSDVYALGVVLYELLSGRLPYDLREKPIPEAVRLITEQDPTRLSVVSRVFRGDIETIAAKALEKDRSRRYQTAAELAEDVRRYLAEQAILARPASAAYQLRKFARRNRALVGGVVTAFILLLAGVIGTGIGMARAVASARVAHDETKHARTEAAKARRSVEFLQNMLASADPENGQPGSLTVREALRQAELTVDAELADEPEVRAAVHYTIGSAYSGLQDDAAAQRHLEEALALRTSLTGRRGIEVSNCLHNLALCRFNKDDYAGAVAGMREALAMAQADPEAPPEAVVHQMIDLAGALRRVGRLDEADPLARQAVELSTSANGRTHAATAQALHMLSLINSFRNPAEAEAAEREAIEIALARFGPRSVKYSTYLLGLGVLLNEQSLYAQAESLIREALHIRIEIFGPDHPRVAATYDLLAAAQLRMRKYDDAEASARESLRIRLARFGADATETASAQIMLAQVLMRSGKVDESEPLVRQAIATRKKVFGQEHVMVAQGIETLGDLYYRRKMYDEALRVLPEAVEMRKRLHGARSPLVTTGIRTMAAAAGASGDHARAAELYLEAEALFSESYPEENAVLIGIRTFLADELAALQRYDQAESKYRAALAGQRKRTGDAGEDLAKCLTGLAGVLKARGDGAGSDEALAQAAQVRGRPASTPAKTSPALPPSKR
jgi:tetratricopeptide (TPR) repeat protein